MRLLHWTVHSGLLTPLSRAALDRSRPPQMPLWVLLGRRAPRRRCSSKLPQLDPPPQPRYSQAAQWAPANFRAPLLLPPPQALPMQPGWRRRVPLLLLPPCAPLPPPPLPAPLPGYRPQVPSLIPLLLSPLQQPSPPALVGDWHLDLQVSASASCPNNAFRRPRRRRPRPRLQSNR